MRIIFILISLTGFFSCGKFIPQTQTDYAIICSQEDSLLVLEKRKQFKDESVDRMSFLLEKIGRSFIGSPYKAHTLELGDKESLVINLREFDCTTFVETCLALTTTFKMGGYTFDSYQYILKRIRYRNGYIDGYNSRLNYFTDWITDNSVLGYVKDATKIFDGIPYPNQVNFMSTHLSSYPQLEKDSTLIPQLKEIEKEISSRQYYYIPKTDIKNNELYLEEGWIVAFTTGIEGLDVIHTGITVRIGDKIHLLHASSDAGMVVVSDESLVDYIMKNKLQTGIILLKID
ncbi:MAG: N-acetylmuramoyl-L-alanine amidase-like domain-containing protein [Prolixibacteraceae bacterium]